MTRLIDADAVWERYDKEYRQQNIYDGAQDKDWLERCINESPTVDAEPVRHGKWLLEAHKENANYRWNVTAECSECSYDLGEIWAGFFRDVPDSIARGACIVSAESIALSKYCPHCGARMGGEKND